MSESQGDALQMFYNEDFSPEEFVDALHSSLMGSAEMYAPSTLGKISVKTQDLVTLLDYNTNEILREMAAKVDQLKKSSGTVGDFHYSAQENGSGPTRLQYYVDSLRNAVETLQTDVQQAKTQIRESEASNEGITQQIGARDPVDTLIQLKDVRANIMAVCDVLKNAKSKVSGESSAGSITDHEFSEAMKTLHESLREKLREADSEERESIEATVKELRAWVPMFQPFSRFGPTYVKYVAKLENEFSPLLAGPFEPNIINECVKCLGWERLLDPPVGDDPDDRTHGDRDYTANDGSGPHGGSLSGHGESSSTNEHNANLHASNDGGNGDKVPVSEQVREKVQVLHADSFTDASHIGTLIQLTRDKQLPESQPDKGVESHCVKLLSSTVGDVTIAEEDSLSCKVQNEGNHQLIDRSSKNHLPHRHTDQRRLPASRFSVQQCIIRLISSQSQCCQGVHDQVDPQQLNCSQNGVAIHGCNSGHERKHTGGDVDSQLELNKFLDRFGNGSAPLDGLHNVGEIIRHQNDVRCFSGNFSTTDTHGETDIGQLQSWSIVGTVTSDGNDFSRLL